MITGSKSQKLLNIAECLSKKDVSFKMSIYFDSKNIV